ncbi:hypothetical protein GC170_21455 [bacterium]|nr:hypothetical protein [bacterium]
MSGPKVISIVSIEEVIEICQVWLSRVDAEIEEWTKIGRRNSVITAADEAAVRQSRSVLLRMLESGQYLPLQKEAPLLTQRLQADMDQRLEKAAESHAGQLRITRSLSFTATSLLQQASIAGTVLPLDVATVLHHASRGSCDDVKAIEHAVSQAVSLTKKSASAVSEYSPMIQEMIANANTESLDDWIRRTSTTEPADRRIAAAEKLISQLIALEERFSGNSFQNRLQELSAMPESPHRGLKLDSICLELKELLESTKRWDAARRNLAELKKEAEVTGDLSELQSQFAEFASLQQQGDIHAASTLISRLRQTLDRRAAGRAAEKKRKALIQGLSELGYSVSSEMTKVWASQKSLVVRKGQQTDTGIELSGDFEAGKCQVRVVAFEGQGNRDRDTGRTDEEQWCSALASLQERLAGSGTGLTIEKATPAGATPLKVVTTPWTHDFEETTEVENRRREEMRRTL